MAEEFSPFRFEFKAEPLVLDFTELPLENFRKVYFESDVFAFFPYGEVGYEDELGTIPDRLLFIEGLEIKIKCGYEDLGYIENDYCWSESQFVDCIVTDHLAGLTNFELLSKQYAKDYKKSKGWKLRRTSDIAREIALNDLQISAEKIFISETDGLNDYPQVNETNRDYLKRIADMSYSRNFPKSPFLTFINSHGEFYFMAIEEMFKKQQSVATFKLKMDINQLIDPEIIKRYDMTFGGMPANKEDYRKKVYSVASTGIYENEITAINEHFTKGPKEKYLLRTQYMPIGLEFSDYLNLGIAETPEEKKIVKGKINSLYKDSMTSTRMNIVVSFDHNCVTGKMVEIEVDSAFEDKQVATEYSGKWLIINDRLMFDGTNKTPYQNLTICKSGIQVDSNHIFYADFLV